METLLLWLKQVLRNRGTYRNNDISKEERHRSYRRYQDTTLRPTHAGIAICLDKNTYGQVLVKSDGSNHTMLDGGYIDSNGKGEARGSHILDIWSNIASLPLWVISERLDLPNKLRLATVCRSWRSYALSFPQTKVVRPPWIMIHDNLSSSKREFISISSKKKYTIDLPDFVSTSCLASKNGWLLLLRDVVLEETSFSLFFLNPITKEKIEMPPIDKNDAEVSSCFAAFSILNRYPHHVGFVYAVNKDSDLRMIRLACCDGDRLWQKTALVQQFLVCTMMIGSTLYCLSGDGSLVLVDNVIRHVWCHLNRHAHAGVEHQEFAFSKSHFMEYQGQLLMVGFPMKNADEPLAVYKLITGDITTYPKQEKQKDKDSNDFPYYILPDGTIKWEKLESDEVRGMSFFLNMNHLGACGYVLDRNSYQIRECSTLSFSVSGDDEFHVTIKRVHAAWNPKSVCPAVVEITLHSGMRTKSKWRGSWRYSYGPMRTKSIWRGCWRYCYGPWQWVQIE